LSTNRGHAYHTVKHIATTILIVKYRSLTL